MAKLQFKLWARNAGYGNNFYSISEEGSDWEEMGYAFIGNREIEIDHFSILTVNIILTAYFD